jgi:hypothetical protein
VPSRTRNCRGHVALTEIGGQDRAWKVPRSRATLGTWPSCNFNRHWLKESRREETMDKEKEKEGIPILGAIAEAAKTNVEANIEGVSSAATNVIHALTGETGKRRSRSKRSPRKKAASKSGARRSAGRKSASAAGTRRTTKKAAASKRPLKAAQPKRRTSKARPAKARGRSTRSRAR